MAEKIRVPSTSVELVLILGAILRKHITLSLQGKECWTFERIVDFSQTSYDDEKGELEVDNYLTVYLGSGYLHAYIEDGPVQKVETRVRCTRNQFMPCNETAWSFELWLRPENGKIMRYRYDCTESFINGDDEIYPIKNMIMALLPPRKIAFKGM